MKYLISLLVFSLSMTVALKSLANEDAGHDGGKAEHRDNNALFPHPVANLNKGTPAATPEDLEPAFMTKVSGTATLKWKESAGADSYHVQIATDPNFKWLKVDEHFVKGTSFEAKGLEAGHRYYWRVASWKSENMAATNKSGFAKSVFELQ